MNVALESFVPNPFADPPRARPVGAELLGFFFAGGTGALAFIVLSVVFVSLHTGVPNWVVSTLCWALLIVPVYTLHRRFAFRTEAPHRQALPRYAAVQACALLLAAAFSYVAYSVLHLPVVWAALTVNALTAAVNFAVLRAWAFARHAPPAEPIGAASAIGDISG